MSHFRPRAVLLAVTIASAIVGCGEQATTAPSSPDPVQRSVGAAAEDENLAWLRSYLASPRAPGRDDPAVIAGAGDIARCYPGAGFTQFRPPGPDHPAQATARLLDDMPGAAVMAVGDNAYEFGSALDYWGCYQPTWGRHRARTRPAAGNHEYLTPGAAGYFLYFRRRAAPPHGYYSYSLGRWHVVVLNSTPQVYACWPPEVDERPPGLPVNPVPDVENSTTGRACAGDVAQQAWLVADLAAHRRSACTLVYFHHPRFSSGPHGNHYQMQRIWDILYAAGADLVIDGHDHLYERFAPQDPEGDRDDRYGIRQITVGTGGAELYSVVAEQPNSEVRLTGVWGVIALALGDGKYSWAFQAVDRTIRDSGTTACHGRPI